MSAHTGVTNCQKLSVFWPTLYNANTLQPRYNAHDGSQAKRVL